MVNLLLRSLPYIYTLGVNVLFLFIFSLRFWFCSFYGSIISIDRFYYMLTFPTILLFLFDIFVVLLRPVTLTLRVFINIILGHTVIIIIRQTLSVFLLLIFIFEIFVYLIQSYVFITLCKSYIDIINYRPSLWLEHPPYDGKVSAC